MSLIKKSISLLLVAVLAVGLAACGEGGEQPSSSTDTGSHRAEYVSDDTDADWVDTDGQFDVEAVAWAGPADYVIVIPAGNSEARDTAEVLQSYYQATAKVTLKIVTDATAEKDKEILIGKTKRSESNGDMAVADLKVSVQGDKLVFDGGHDVTVDSAVQKFCRLDYESGKANTFAVTTDFSTSPNVVGLEDYEYVWGDEFEGTDVDMTKWSFHSHMTGTTRAMISYDRDVIDTGDGRLKLHALRYFDPEREGTNYKMPYSTTTKNNMNFIYGYAEIRARMPFFKGAWPSFWTQSTDVVSSKYGRTRTQEYFVEIDVFEVFGSPDKVVSNIHKWYNANYYDYNTIHNIENATSNHTQWNKEKDVWQGNALTVNQEYHVYGWEWNTKEMVIYVDGEKIMTYDIVNSYDKYTDMTGFHDPEFVMFNNHVTSTDASYQVGVIEDSLDMLPSEYYIDYFRLYQKNDGKSKLYLDDTPNVYLDRE